MKKVFTVIALTSLAASLSAFDWPLDHIKTENLKSFFAQKRGNSVSSSLLIQKEEQKTPESEPEKVKLSEDGKITAIINNIKDDNDFFPSTLGNALIVTHQDGILSVYGNLEENSIPEEFEDSPSLEKGAELGLSGLSAWTETGNTLELQILDSKNKTAINPRLLFSKIEKEGTFVPSDILVENKDGKKFELANVKGYQAGTYRFYQKRNDNLVPLKTVLLVNGQTADELNFDHLSQENSKVLISGSKKKYTGNVLYPPEKYIFMGEAKLTPGKLVLTFENYNHNGDKRMVNYNITVY